MSDRYVRGLITANPPADPDPALGAAASGMWTMEQYYALQKQGKWPTKDPYFNQTTLLLHGNGGLSGATNNSGDPTYLAFADNSDNDFPITVNGGAYGDNSSPFQVPEGYWSNYFDGSNDNLTVAYNSALNISGDFTIEAWIYLTGNAAAAPGDGNRSANIYSIDLPSNGANDFLFFNIRGDSTTTGTGFNLRFNNSGTYTGPSVTTTITQHEWHHIAVCRSSGSYYMFLDGVSQSYTGDALAATLTSTGTRRIGHWDEFNNSFPWYFPGYIANFRHTNEALYTANFTPSTSPLTTTSQGASSANVALLTCQSNRFVDNSDNSIAVTPNNGAKVQPLNPFTTDYNTVDGSGYFDGTGDWIYAADNAAFTLGSSDFTIEFWMYNGTTGVRQFITGQTNSAGSNTAASFAIQKNSSNKIIGAVFQSSTGYDAISTNDAPLNAWTHIAFVRDGNTTRLYINGVQDGTANVTGVTVNDSSNTLSIGRLGELTADNFPGYISNYRMVVGTCLYPNGTTFIPSTTALTAVSGTELLTVQYQGAVRNGGFIDSSPNDFLITANGNTTQGTFSPFSAPDGRWSNYFDGSGDYLSLANNAAFDLSSSDFTISFWLYPTSSSFVRLIVYNQNTVNNSDYAFAIDKNGLNNINFGSASGNTWTSTPSSNTVQLNAWNFIVVKRVTTTATIYVNGVSTVVSAYSPFNNPASSTLTIGADRNGTSPLSGYLSNVRIVKGSALTPSGIPTEPLTAVSGTSLLTCQSNRFVDNSTNNFAITRNGDAKVTPFSPFAPTAAYSPSVNGGSGYFDGSGDYLTAPASPAYEFSGDFTIEFWVKTATFNINTYYRRLLCFGTDGATNLQLLFFNGSAATTNLSVYSNVMVVTGTIPVATDEWNHIALCRSGTSLKLFVNGVQSGSTSTTSQNFNAGASNGVYVGRYAIDGGYLSGYMSGLRILNGTALYTSAFTPPTAPATADANTSLLLNFTNAGIYDSTGKNNLETVGNAQVDTSTVKFGTGSMKFDGTGDYLDVPSSDLFNFGTGDFTIEAWIYRLEADRSQMIFAVGNSDVTTGHGRFYVFSGNTLRYYNNGNITTSSTVLSLNTWHHVALVQESGSQTLYLDGVSVGTSTSGVAFGGNTLDVEIGSNPATTTQRFNGYIDDLRITKGVARYTSNFTPQTSQWQDQ